MKYKDTLGHKTLEHFNEEEIQAGVKHLERIQFIVGILMREISELRMHQNRDKLIELVRTQIKDAPVESILRAQRKIWETALEQLEKGNKEYASNFIPVKPDDFKTWCEARRIGEEKYRRYSSNL